MAIIRKPWLEKNGRMKPLNEIKSLAKTWGPTTWESYMSYCEAPQTEILTGQDFGEIDKKITPWDLSQTDDNEAFERRVEAAMAILTPHEAQVLRLIVWEELSQREVAKMLGMAKTTVVTHRNRAYTKIGCHMVAGGKPKVSA